MKLIQQDYSDIVDFTWPRTCSLPHVSMTGYYYVEMTEGINLVFGTEAILGVSYTRPSILREFWYLRKIRMFPSGAISQNLADFFAFSPQHVDRGRRCRRIVWPSLEFITLSSHLCCLQHVVRHAERRAWICVFKLNCDS